MAAEDPSRLLLARRLRSRTPVLRLPHKRAAPFTGQRVMRHFLHAGPNRRCRAAAAFAVAPLTLGMLVAAPATILVALTRKAYRSTPRPAAAVPRTVDVAVVATTAENHLAMAQGAVEQAGGVLHRDLMRTGRIRARTRTILRIRAVPCMARGVRRRSLPPSRRGRRRIVLGGLSVAPQ